MAEIPLPKSQLNYLTDNQEQIQNTLVDRIHTIIGKELIDKDYLPSAYAEAVLASGGEEHKIVYHYAQIRYKALYATAERKLKLSNEIKSL